MDSVELDLLSMPEVKVGRRLLDTLVVCVDRLSGWIVAVPVPSKELTSALVQR